MKRLGLALGSGGIRGAAHIGVIKCLEDHGIEIGIIGGCSAGAVVGGLYSIDGNSDNLRGYLRRVNMAKAGKKYSYFLEFRRMLAEIRTLAAGKTIEELAIPFRAVATDISTGREVIFDSGDLATAMVSSAAIPFILPSVSIPGKNLVDGALTMPVPVGAIRQEAEVVIAVNLYHGVVGPKLPKVIQAIYTPICRLAEYNCQEAEIAIEPNDLTTEIGSDEAVEAMIESGYQAMERHIPRLRQLIGEKKSS